MNNKRYDVEIKFMHGDADAYTTETIKVDSLDDVKKIQEGIRKYDAINWNSKCGLNTKGLKKIFEQIPEFFEYLTYHGGDYEGDEVYDLDKVFDESWGEIYWPRDVVYNSNFYSMLYGINGVYEYIEVGGRKGKFEVKI